MNAPATPHLVTYALEQLFHDQDRDWVVDTIAPLLAWVPGTTRRSPLPPFRFGVAHTQRKATRQLLVDLSWDEEQLEQLIPGVKEHARRLRVGRTVQREHLTELAAYGLTFVAISALMPGRRVLHMQMGAGPDILFDVTPGALRGVETAGRARGGRSALKTVRNGAPSSETGKPGAPGKAELLAARADLVEVHLSLWCASPRIGSMEQLKP